MDQDAPIAAEPGSSMPAPSSSAAASSVLASSVLAPLPLPPPPPPFTPDAAPWVRPPKRPGQLSPIWRLVFGVGWVAIIVCNAALWESSRVIGLSTWWLGADAQPRLIVFQLLPFYGPILVTIAAISNWRFLPYFGMAAAVVGAAIGAGDLGRVRWFAVVELVLAGAALCISAASLAGMYRPAEPGETAG